jgi:hypothetical protein
MQEPTSLPHLFHKLTRMSGLTRYFQKEFSSSSEDPSSFSYHQSLKDIPTAAAAAAAAAAATDDDENGAVVIVDWNWKDYQQTKAASMERFLEARLRGISAEPSSPQNNKENLEQQQRPSGAATPAAAAAATTATTDWETQPPEVLPVGLEPFTCPFGTNHNHLHHRTRTRTMIPLFSELKQQTIHSVSEIDYYAHKIHLQICHIVKYVTLRETKRGIHHPIYQDDGPLAVAYKHVLDFELRQINTTIGMDPTNTQQQQLKQCIQQLQNQKHRDAQNTIHVFLYNAFAKQFHDIVDCMHKYTKQHAAAASSCQTKHTEHANHDSWQVYVQLQSVPAQCVWQHTTKTTTTTTGRNNHHDDHNDWYPKTNFCLCIGDKSRLCRKNDIHDKKSYLWFCNHTNKHDSNQDSSEKTTTTKKSSSDTTTTITTLSVILVNNRENKVHLEYILQSHPKEGACSTRILPSSSSSSTTILTCTTTSISTLQQAYYQFRKQMKITNHHSRQQQRQNPSSTEEEEEEEEQEHHDESPELFPMETLVRS